ncbi:MAG: insulinase family protein [Erysipelotrichaceae bacterium]|nr:insulinase family protein [Erysipelotrichaceae bacterium]
MDYEQFDMGSYHLHIIKTKKFKTITVEVNFRRKIKKEEITIRNLLKTVLLSTTQNFKTERELIKETENLYDLKLISSNMRIGNYSNLSFKVRFLNELYTEESMNEYSIAFLMDVLFHPNIVDNQFTSEEVKKAKSKLEKSIQKLSDNKLKYALIKLLETTKDKPYSYSSFGSILDLEAITPASLYEYYKSVLRDDYVDIFVVGDVDVSKMKKIFKKYFKANTFKKEQNNILVEELPPRKRIKKQIEYEKANQSQLTILCTMNGLTEFERKYVVLVYNEILGGSSNSLLFDTVREKNSYAYYVNSNQKAYDNILMIYSGIEPGNYENVLKLIRKTLSNINKGSFNDDVLENAKETIIASIKASTDSPAGIINTYYAKVLVGSGDFSKRIENIKQVSKEDVINLSKKIAMHTVFLLEGNNEEDTDEEN